MPREGLHFVGELDFVLVFLHLLDMLSACLLYMSWFVFCYWWNTKMIFASKFCLRELANAKCAISGEFFTILQNISNMFNYISDSQYS